jgi:hypothetical protein
LSSSPFLFPSPSNHPKHSKSPTVFMPRGRKRYTSKREIMNSCELKYILILYTHKKKPDWPQLPITVLVKYKTRLSSKHEYEKQNPSCK